MPEWRCPGVTGRNRESSFAFFDGRCRGFVEFASCVVVSACVVFLCKAATLAVILFGAGFVCGAAAVAGISWEVVVSKADAPRAWVETAAGMVGGC